MTTETETYPNETAWHNTMKRGSLRPSTGWRMLSNSKDRLEITWSNDPPPPPPPKRQLTQRAFLDELAEQQGVEII